VVDLGDAMDVAAVIDIITRLGLPIGILAVLAYYHAQVVKAKDDDLKRLHDSYAEKLHKLSDQRVAEAKSYMELTQEQMRETTKVLGDIDKTIAVIEAIKSKK